MPELRISNDAKFCRKSDYLVRSNAIKTKRFIFYKLDDFSYKENGEKHPDATNSQCYHSRQKVEIQTVCKNKHITNVVCYVIAILPFCVSQVSCIIQVETIAQCEDTID